MNRDTVLAFEMLIFGLHNALTAIIIYYVCKNYLDLSIHHYLYISTYCPVIIKAARHHGVFTATKNAVI